MNLNLDNFVLKIGESNFKSSVRLAQTPEMHEASADAEDAHAGGTSCGREDAMSPGSCVERPVQTLL